MKEHVLQYPFRGGIEKKVLLQEGILFVPDRLEQYAFPEFSSLFGNDRPVHVEYCSGNGAWIISKAEEYPEINWIAIEKKYDRVSKIWTKRQKRGLKNLIVIYGEGLNITRRFIPENSIAHSFVNFPDPWPKKRHWKHRIIQQPFLDEMERILNPSGMLTLVTDDIDYSTVMTEEMKVSKKFSSLHPDPFFVTELAGYGSSYFESLWRSFGKSICYHQWKSCKL